MPRAEERRSPEVLPMEALLPSQRTLLSLEAPHTPHSFRGLSQNAINQLGELFAYELTMVVDEHLSARIDANNSADTRYRDQQLHALGTLAGHLLEYDRFADPYKGMTEHQRNSCSIEESLRVKATVQDGYDPERYLRMGSRPTYDPRYGYFTPQGLVHEPVGDFQQKVVVVDVDRKSLFAEDDYFNLSTQGHLYLYTDNLSAETPFWEYHEQDTPPDMFPSGRSYEPYFFHAVPPRFVSEDLALSTVESLARVFATSTRDELAEEAAYEARAQHNT